MKKVMMVAVALTAFALEADVMPLVRPEERVLTNPSEVQLEHTLATASLKRLVIVGRGNYALRVPQLSSESVQELEIQNCDIADLKGLAGVKSVRRLILRNVKVEGSKVFPPLPGLEVFMAWDSEFVDGNFDWSFLCDASHLRWLTIWKARTQKPIDLSLVAKLPDLRTVALGGSSVANIDAVKDLPNLSDLDIRDVRGVKSVAGFEKCRHMNRMVVTRRYFPELETETMSRAFAKSGGHLIQVPANGRKADGDKLWEVCFDESLGTNRIGRLEKLLASGCDPNDPTFSDKLVLTELVNGWQKFDETDCAMVELLLKHGADVRKGASLCKLCGQKYDRANGRLKAVELLLDKGLDPNEVDDSGNSILQIIADRGGDDVGDAGLVDLLLRRGADPKKGAVSLCELCGKFGLERTNRVAIVSALLKKGMNVNEVGKRGLSVLGMVTENSMIEKAERLALAKLLLEHGADVNAMIGFGAFRKTILDKVLSDHGSDEALQALFLPYAGDLKASRVSLHDLYESGSFNGETGIRKLESLLSKGCDPNERGFGGASLLMVVAEGKRRSDGTNDLVIAKVLLTHGADPNASTTFGETALGNVVKRSAFDGQLSFAQLLLDKGADPNAADHVGNTLLMRLFGRGFDESKLELMKLLLERGADVKGGERRQSVLDQVGNWQVGTQKLDIVRMLVGKGAPVTDGAICSAWRDEHLRRYLLEQSGKTEGDFEVWSSGSSFSVRTKRKNGHRADLERLHREMDERRIEREERHHQERMSHERLRRTVEERISADRRQNEETRAERNLAVCQELAERRRGELLRGIPVENRQKFESWLASRRKDESAALESARNRAQMREVEAKLRRIQDRQHRMSTSIVIAIAVVLALAIVLAVVSLWRRRRQGVRNYGTCQHESDVVVNYFRCLRKYADFSGRADRSEYWSFALTNGLISFLIRLVGASWLDVAFAAVMMVPWLAVATRRLHDVGRSGWRLMFVLVPFVVVAVYGDMPMREVHELGWDEDLFTMVLVLSMCMLLVFGIWTLVLLLRKGQDTEEDVVRSPAGDKGKFFVDDGGQKAEIPMSEVDKYCKEHGCAPGIAMLALAARKGMERHNQGRPAPQEMDLPFLGRNPGFNDSVVKNLQDFVSQEGNFRLKLPKSIVPEVAVKALSPSNAHFHFKGQDRFDWVHIEYMTNAHGGADIREWVEAPVVMFGKPMLGIEEKFEVVKFGWMPAVSANYLKRHKADEMATFAGSVRIGETVCRVFMVCFRRGDEAWKVEYGFPAVITDATVNGPIVTHKMRKPNPGEKVPPDPSRAEMEEAAKVLGWFRPYDAVKCRFCGKIVSDEEVFTVELENVKSDFLPIRTAAIVSIPCCPDCSQRQATGTDLARIKEDEIVKNALDGGGRIKQTWLDAHK